MQNDGPIRRALLLHVAAVIAVTRKELDKLPDSKQLLEWFVVSKWANELMIPLRLPV